MLSVGARPLAKEFSFVDSKSRLHCVQRSTRIYSVSSTYCMIHNCVHMLFFLVAEPDFKLADHLAGKESPADDVASVDDAQAGSESKEAELMDEKGAEDKQSIAVSYTASPDPVLDEPTLAAETEVQAEQAPAALIDAVADEVALVQPQEAAALPVDDPVPDMPEPQEEAEVTLEPQQAEVVDEPQQAVIVDEPQQQAVIDEPQQQAVVDEQEQSVPVQQADIIAEASIEPIEPAAAAAAEEDAPVPTVIEQEVAPQPVEAVSSQVGDAIAVPATALMVANLMLPCVRSMMSLPSLLHRLQPHLWRQLHQPQLSLSRRLSPPLLRWLIA